MSSTEPTAVVDSAGEMTAENFLSLKRGDDLEIRLDVSDFDASQEALELLQNRTDGLTL